MQEGGDVDLRLIKCARYKGTVEEAKALLADGCELEAKNKYGNTALFYAIVSSNVPVMNYLIDQGASLTTRNKEGSTLLHVAASGHLTERVVELLRRGADPNVQDLSGRTPLHDSLTHSCPSLEFIQAFLRAGADPTIEDLDGETAITACDSFGNEPALFLLKSAAKTFEQSRGI
ncbi:MAG: ankyrin repeat domain-containing protein [Chthoniobacteraceae bacterium]